MPQPLPPPVVIDQITALPASPLNGTGTVGVILTNGIPTYYQVIGANLDRIKKVMWYPQNPNSILYQVRGMILVDNTQGSFMIKVIDNYLQPFERGGQVAFVLDDSTTITFPTQTWGPLSAYPIWTAPTQGLITG